MIVVRDKPGKEVCLRNPMQDAARVCFAVITHASMATAEALLEGVSAICNAFPTDNAMRIVGIGGDLGSDASAAAFARHDEQTWKGQQPLAV